MKEIETKFRLQGTEPIKKGLKRIGAKAVSKDFEKDTYYRLPQPSAGALTIRLRSIGNKGVFTIKASCSGENSRTYKVREELEVGVSDAKRFDEMLKLLGFAPRFRKEKIRETYEWKDAKIAIDKLPFIGYYAEIEAPKKKINELARLLGLDMQKAIPDTYMELFNYYRIMRKKPNLELVFDNAKAEKGREGAEGGE